MDIYEEHTLLHLKNKWHRLILQTGRMIDHPCSKCVPERKWPEGHWYQHWASGHVSPCVHSISTLAHSELITTCNTTVLTCSCDNKTFFCVSFSGDVGQQNSTYSLHRHKVKVYAHTKTVLCLRIMASGASNLPLLNSSNLFVF